MDKLTKARNRVKTRENPTEEDLLLIYRKRNHLLDKQYPTFKSNLDILGATSIGIEDRLKHKYDCGCSLDDFYTEAYFWARCQRFLTESARVYSVDTFQTLVGLVFEKASQVRSSWLSISLLAIIRESENPTR